MSHIPDPSELAAPLAALEQRLAAAAAGGEPMPPEALEMLAQLRTLNAALAELTESLRADPPRERAGE